MEFKPDKILYQKNPLFDKIEESEKLYGTINDISIGSKFELNRTDRAERLKEYQKLNLGLPRCSKKRVYFTKFMKNEFSKRKEIIHKILTDKNFMRQYMAKELQSLGITCLNDVDTEWFFVVDSSYKPILTNEIDSPNAKSVEKLKHVKQPPGHIFKPYSCKLSQSFKNIKNQLKSFRECMINSLAVEGPTKNIFNLLSKCQPKSIFEQKLEKSKKARYIEFAGKTSSIKSINKGQTYKVNLLPPRILHTYKHSSSLVHANLSMGVRSSVKRSKAEEFKNLPSVKYVRSNKPNRNGKSVSEKNTSIKNISIISDDFKTKSLILLKKSEEEKLEKHQENSFKTLSPTLKSDCTDFKSQIVDKSKESSQSVPKKLNENILSPKFLSEHSQSKVLKNYNDETFDNSEKNKKPNIVKKKIDNSSDTINEIVYIPEDFSVSINSGSTYSGRNSSSSLGKVKDKVKSNISDPTLSPGQLQLSLIFDNDKLDNKDDIDIETPFLENSKTNDNEKLKLKNFNDQDNRVNFDKNKDIEELILEKGMYNSETQEITNTDSDVTYDFERIPERNLMNSLLGENRECQNVSSIELFNNLCRTSELKPTKIYEDTKKSDKNINYILTPLDHELEVKMDKPKTLSKSSNISKPSHTKTPFLENSKTNDNEKLELKNFNDQDDRVNFDKDNDIDKLVLERRIHTLETQEISNSDKDVTYDFERTPERNLMNSLLGEKRECQNLSSTELFSNLYRTSELKPTKIYEDTRKFDKNINYILTPLDHELEVKFDKTKTLSKSSNISKPWKLKNLRPKLKNVIDIKPKLKNVIDIKPKLNRRLLSDIRNLPHCEVKIKAQVLIEKITNRLNSKNNLSEKIAKILRSHDYSENKTVVASVPLSCYSLINKLANINLKSASTIRKNGVQISKCILDTIPKRAVVMLNPKKCKMNQKNIKSKINITKHFGDTKSKDVTILQKQLLERTIQKENVENKEINFKLDKKMK